MAQRLAFCQFTTYGSYADLHWFSVVYVKGLGDLGASSGVRFAESTGLRRLERTLQRLRCMLDRILNPETGRTVTLMTWWYEMHLRDLTAVIGDRKVIEDRKAVKAERIRAFVRDLHDSDRLRQGLKESLGKLTREQVVAVRRMVVENNFVLDVSLLCRISIHVRAVGQFLRNRY